MKFKETVVDAPDSTKKKKPKKKSKREWKATVVYSKDYVSDKARKAKEKVKELRNITFATTKMYWDSYALMMANYFSDEYVKNLNYFEYKYKELNNKKTLNDDEMLELEAIVSLDILNTDIANNPRKREINVDLDSIDHDFYEIFNQEDIYKSLIVESKKVSHHSIEYLLKLFNFLLTYIKEKDFRVKFYDVIISQEKKAKDKDKHPIIFNEKTIDKLEAHQYQATRFKAKEPYKNEQN